MCLAFTAALVRAVCEFEAKSEERKEGKGWRMERHEICTVWYVSCRRYGMYVVGTHTPAGRAGRARAGDRGGRREVSEFNLNWLLKFNCPTVTSHTHFF